MDEETHGRTEGVGEVDRTDGGGSTAVVTGAPAWAAAQAAYWMCVVSRADAHLAQREGRLRLSAASERRVRRLSEGDGVLLYSPREGNRRGAVVRRFTAVGTVVTGTAYQLGDDPHGSWCRDVRFDEVRDEVEVAPLLERLSFVRPGAGWGVAFRPGFVRVAEADHRLVRAALTAGLTGAATGAAATGAAATGVGSAGET